MEGAILIAIVFSVMAAVWRVVFELLQQEPLSAATPPPRRPHWTDRVRARSRADTHLRRVIALTGATQNGNTYSLNVGTIRFEVWDRFVTRRRGSDGRYDEETCFGPAYQGMPTAEKIATALLQLRNNPELFEKWAKKETAFKADGQPFRRGVVMI